MINIDLDIKTFENKLVITVDKSMITPEYIIELMNWLQFQSKLFTPKYFQTISNYKAINQDVNEIIPIKKREWKYSGTVNLNHKLDNINLRDFAYE